MRWVHPHHPLDRKWTFLCTFRPEVSIFTGKEALYEQLAGYQNWSITWGKLNDHVLSSHGFRYERKWAWNPLFGSIFINLNSVWSTFRWRKSLAQGWVLTACSLRRRNWHWQIPEVTPCDRKWSILTGNGPKSSVKAVFHNFSRQIFTFFQSEYLLYTPKANIVACFAKDLAIDYLYQPR